MKSPQDKSTIQVEITNACVFECSNCTRFCGHHKKPFFMDFETFKKAVASLEGYPMILGIMGGEPTLHPEFEKFARYLAEVREPQLKYDYARKPMKSFLRSQLWHCANMESKRGLWTSLGTSYYKNFEVIQDVFEFQVINDHANPGVHQALLATRKDLGIPDDEWFKLRDNCWVQNNWSSAITPKGAFFCEVAAALDMLFDGPGGWPIEKGWWKRQPEDFGDQLHWCEMCSGALDVPVIEGNRELDFISSSILEKLKANQSPKVKKGKYILLKSDTKYDGKTSGAFDRWGTWNLPEKDSKYRISETNTSLFPKDISVIFQAEGEKPVIDKPFHEINEDQFRKIEFGDWVLIIRDYETIENNLKVFSDNIFNPGCFYYFISDSSAKETGNSTLDAKRIWNESKLILMNKRALALKSLENLSLGPELISYYTETKVIHLDNYPFLEVFEWGTDFTEYEILQQIWRDLGKAFAGDRSKGLLLFGAGMFTRKLLAAGLSISDQGPLITGIIDDKFPEGQCIAGIPVRRPSVSDAALAEAVFVSTDSIEGILGDRVKELYEKSLPILNFSSLKNHAVTGMREQNMHANKNKITNLLQPSAVMEQMWTSMGKDYPPEKGGLIIFGAGAFTRKLLGSVTKVQNGPRIKAIIDDKARNGQTIGGIPVQKPDDICLKDASAVLLATDTVENVLLKRAEALYKNKIPLLRYSKLRNEGIFSILKNSGMPVSITGLGLPESAKRPLVSVICYVKNRASMISRCVESVLNQDYPNIEFIIQDGGSTDGTLEILKSYGDRIKLEVIPDDTADEACWNCITRCKGDYMTSCLSDEELLPEAISSSVALMERCKDVGMVFRDYLTSNALGDVIEPKITKNIALKDLLFCKQPWYCCSALLLRMSAFEKIGLHDRNWLPRGGDFDYIIRLMAKFPTKHLPGFVLKFGVDNGRLSELYMPTKTHLDARLQIVREVMLDSGFSKDEINAALLANVENIRESMNTLYPEKKTELEEFFSEMMGRHSLK